MPVSDRDVRIVQTAYPQIYFACHTRHVRRASTATRRAIDLLLSAKGAAAMQASSVLESARVKKMLGSLAPAQRKRALEGLSLLAKAARASNGGRK